jgi:ABC-type uncharacterized transport system involved in gliding motility auxiliary subunit
VQPRATFFRMQKKPDTFEDLVITIKPDVTPEEEDRFIQELARIIVALARRLAAKENLEPEDLETIAF